MLLNWKQLEWGKNFLFFLVAKLSKRLVGTEAERNQLEREISDLREKYGEIKQEHDSVVIENKSKLGVEVHLTTVNELKR